MPGSAGPADSVQGGSSPDSVLRSLWCSICDSFRGGLNRQCVERKSTDQLVICEDYIPRESTLTNTEVIERSSA
jgi:hypothetical protein